MPITHAAHGSPITAADYDAEHVGGAGGGPGVNQATRLVMIGGPSGGDFTLNVTVGAGSVEETGAIAFDADGDDVKAALEALADIGSGDVFVFETGPFPDPIVVYFEGSVAATPIIVEAANNGLTGGSSPEVFPAIEQFGTAAGGNDVIVALSDPTEDPDWDERDGVIWFLNDQQLSTEDVTPRVRMRASWLITTLIAVGDDGSSRVATSGPGDPPSAFIHIHDAAGVSLALLHVDEDGVQAGSDVAELHPVLTFGNGGDLPTVDPHVVGALWADDGIVTVSAG